jgi:hypothetical protein
MFLQKFFITPPTDMKERIQGSVKANEKLPPPTSPSCTFLKIQKKDSRMGVSLGNVRE